METTSVMPLNHVFRMIEKQSIENKQISDEQIEYVLSYVKPSEQRVLKCSMKDNIVKCLLRCDVPTYSTRPANYLSSSELMISTAQVGHILIDNYVRDNDFEYRDIFTVDKLKELRDGHEIYFISVTFRFHGKVPANDYEIVMSLEKYKKLKNNFVAKFKFNVGNEIIGSFIGLISNPKNQT